MFDESSWFHVHHIVENLADEMDSRPEEGEHQERDDNRERLFHLSCIVVEYKPLVDGFFTFLRFLKNILFL